jgi:hypothetical protein
MRPARRSCSKVRPGQKCLIGPCATVVKLSLGRYGLRHLG